jgi:hypothetical protein
MKKHLLPKMPAIACILSGFTRRAKLKAANPAIINSNSVLHISNKDHDGYGGIKQRYLLLIFQRCFMQ